MLWASTQLGRPVKWISTRSGGLLGDTHGRDQWCTASSRSTTTARSSALRAHSMHQVGAHFVGRGMVPAACSRCASPGVYDIPALHRRAARACSPTRRGRTLSRRRPAGGDLPDRAADRPCGAQIGIDPVEIRRRNLHPAGSKCPTTTPTYSTYDSGDFARVMDKCLELADWKGYENAPPRRRRTASCAAAGVCYYLERRHLQRAHGAALRSERHGDDLRRHAFARPGPRDRVRADGKEWLGVPFETSASCRATPTRCRSAAAPTPRAASLVGGNALRKPPTRSSTRRSRWRRA